MRTAELIFNLIRGVVALGLFALMIAADLAAWCCQQVSAGCQRAAAWIIGE